MEIGLSFFLLIDGSFFPVHIVARNYPNACSVAAKRKCHMQRLAIGRPAHGVITGFGLTMLYVLGEKESAVGKHLLGFRHRN